MTVTARAKTVGRGDPTTNGHDRRVPPHDLDAEASLLGSCLLASSAVEVLVSETRVSDFYGPGNQHLAEAIRAVAGRQVDVNAVTVADELRHVGLLETVGGVARLGELQNVIPPVSAAAHFARIITDAGARRGLIALSGELADAGYSLRDDPATAIVKARALLDGWDERSITASSPLTFVDWSTFWQHDREPADWIFPDVLARGRGHSMYAARKTGKSLFMLFVAATIVTTRPDTIVAYLDYEMTEDDLYERLVDMGYGPDTDFSRLRYALLPSLPPLDTPDGGTALFAFLDGIQAEHPAHHLVLIIDTTSRAWIGKENDSDTARAFYRFSGLGLKQRGITCARLDHAGKDDTLGQRGSSAKGDDVDVVWKLARTDTGIELRREAARMNWVPASVVFAEGSKPLRFVATGTAWPTGTISTAAALDELGVPLEASATEAIAVLRDADQSCRKQVLLAALKYRRLPVPTNREPVAGNQHSEPLFGDDA